MRLHQLKKGPTMRQQAPRWTLVIKRCPLLLCLSLAVHSGQIVTVTSHTLIESCNLTSTQQKGRDSVYIRHTQPQISTFGPLPPSQPRPYNLSWSQFDTSLTLSYSMGRMWSHGYPHLMIFFHTDSPPAGYSPVFLSSLIVMLSYWRPHSVCPHIQHYICAIKHTHYNHLPLFSLSPPGQWLAFSLSVSRYSPPCPLLFPPSYRPLAFLSLHSVSHGKSLHGISSHLPGCCFTGSNVKQPTAHECYKLLYSIW